MQHVQLKTKFENAIVMKVLKETERYAFRDCYDAYRDGYTVDRVYTILPTGWTGSPFTVFCDMTTDGGGWTVSCTH